MSKTTVCAAAVRLCILSLTTLFAANVAFAQPEQPDLSIDAATRTQVINAILKRLNDSYVFPEVAKKMEQSIRGRAEKKEYDQITRPSAATSTCACATHTHRFRSADRGASPQPKNASNAGAISPG